MNIIDVISQEGLIYDRHLNTTLALPYSGFDTIAIAQNELATADTINMALNKLYSNFSYLYKSCRLASNLIPLSSVGFIGTLVPGEDLQWHTASPLLSTSQFTQLGDGLDNVQVITGGINSALNQYVFFASSGPDIIALRGDTQLNSISVVLSTVHTGIGSNVNFSNISSFYLDVPNNNLFVCDMGTNTIHKYKVNGLFTDTTILQNVLIYERSIGGLGGYDDHLLFNDPTDIYVFQSFLYVLDSKNACIKKYDSNLNWINTYRLFRDFANVTPISLMFEPLSGDAYVLTDTNTIFRYDPEFSVKTDIILPSLSANGEYYQSVIPSATNSNIFYLTTNKNVFKRFITDPTYAVGPYLFYVYNVNTQEDIKSIISFANGGNDNNLLFSTASARGLFSLYSDSLNLKDILATNSFDIYAPDEVAYGYDEYIQNWVFNKYFARIVTNHIRLRDQIIGKFLYTEDNNHNVVFNGIRYTQPAELTTVSFSQDITSFIGCNEILQNAIVNRALKAIFDIQVSLYNLLQADVVLNNDPNAPVYL